MSRLLWKKGANRQPNPSMRGKQKNARARVMRNDCAVLTPMRIPEGAKVRETGVLARG